MSRLKKYNPFGSRAFVTRAHLNIFCSRGFVIRAYLLSAILLLFLFYSCSSPSQKEIITPTNLRTELLENPEGIDALNPQLSWIIKSNQRNIEQTAYQILVASSPEMLENNDGNLWNSGKVNSNKSIHVKYNGEKLINRQRCWWKIKVWSKNGESEWSQPAYFSMGQLNYNDWAGRWIGFDRTFPWEEKVKFPTIAARYFRTEFNIKPDKEIKHASAYIMGLGWYELYLNGKKVGDQVLAPSPTDYSKNVKYNSFDVTGFLQKEDNAVGIALGCGRYSAMRPNYKPYKIKDFGFPKVLFNLFIEYTDGTTDVIRTANNWKGTADGPICANNEYDGETYDARKEMPGWTKTGFDDSKWLKAEYVQEPRGEFEAQMNENIRIMDTIHPVSVHKLKPGVFIMDMGQNMAGWIQLKVKGQRGTQIKLRFAESLTEDGELFTRALRDAKATDYYILKGSKIETWHPIFTYHGFRFVEITGYPETPKLENFEGHVVYDNMQTTGTFETSNKLINQIYKNAFWSINGTYKGIPIDCPQRNERMPWLGDRAIGCYGESFVMDNSKLYLKWLDDIRNSQKADGCVSDVAPPYFRYYSDNMTWPGTYIFVTDMLYRQYGMVEPIREHYPSMKKWLYYMMNRYMIDYIITKDSYGDWCAPPKTIEEGRGKSADVKHPSALISTAYLYKYLQVMQDFANLSNNQQDISEYQIIADSVKQAFNNEFYNPEKSFYGEGLLTENILAVAFDLVPANVKESVLSSLKDILTIDNNGHSAVGLIGAQWLMRTLSDNGMEDIAYKIATNTSYPSWGYMVENGATTIWELWNATTAHPKMNSQNHVMMLGDLIIWYNEYLAGIKSDVDNPGFKKIILNPVFPDSLDFVNASYKSMYGSIKSHWTKTGNSLSWKITIPANTTAEVHFPTDNTNSITEERLNLKDIYGIHSITKADSEIVIELGSGEYNFEIK